MSPLDPTPELIAIHHHGLELERSLRTSRARRDVLIWLALRDGHATRNELASELGLTYSAVRKVEERIQSLQSSLADALEAGTISVVGEDEYGLPIYSPGTGL